VIAAARFCLFRFWRRNFYTKPRNRQISRDLYLPFPKWRRNFYATSVNGKNVAGHDHQRCRNGSSDRRAVIAALSCQRTHHAFGLPALRNLLNILQPRL
jgi:hypothetical protein